MRKLLALVCLLALAGCGGGGDSAASDTTESTTETTTNPNSIGTVSAATTSTSASAPTTPTIAAAATTTAPADPDNPKYSDRLCAPTSEYCRWPIDANNLTISDEVCNMPLKEAGDAFALIDVGAQRRVLDEMDALCFFPQVGLTFYLSNLGLLP